GGHRRRRHRVRPGLGRGRVRAVAPVSSGLLSTAVSRPVWARPHLHHLVRAARSVRPALPAAAARGTTIMTPLLSVRGLSKSFGGLKALDGVAFDLAEREILGVIGPNGAGKTTLFGVIAASLSPGAGEVYLGARNMTGLPAHRV